MMSSNIERLMRISIRMRKVCTFLIIAFPINLVLDWSNLEFVTENMGMLDGLRFEAEFVGAQNIALGLLINSILTTFAILALYNLRKFFICNSEGNTFTSEAAMALYRFSQFLTAYALAVVPVETALGMAITMNHPVGERVLQATVSSEQLALIFLGFVFFACSWMLKESVQIAEENAQIV